MDLFRGNVLTELQVQNGVLQLGLADAVLADLADAVTANADYAVDIKWSPDWIKPGEPHVWMDDDGTYARCNDCVAESPASASRADAHAWHASHWAAQHAENPQGHV